MICDEEAVPRLEEIIFRETTTIGIRRMPVSRSVLSREVKEIETPLGRAAVKVCTGGMGRRIYPEYESIASLARQHGLPYGQVEQQVMQEAVRQEGGGYEKETTGRDRSV